VLVPLCRSCWRVLPPRAVLSALSPHRPAQPTPAVLAPARADSTRSPPLTFFIPRRRQFPADPRLIREPESIPTRRIARLARLARLPLARAAPAKGSPSGQSRREAPFSTRARSRCRLPVLHGNAILFCRLEIRPLRLQFASSVFSPVADDSAVPGAHFHLEVLICIALDRRDSSSRIEGRTQLSRGPTRAWPRHTLAREKTPASFDPRLAIHAVDWILLLVDGLARQPSVRPFAIRLSIETRNRPRRSPALPSRRLANSKTCIPGGTPSRPLRRTRSS